MHPDELWKDEEIDPHYAISIKDLLTCVPRYRHQPNEPLMTHAAVPRKAWALLGRPRHLLVHDDCLVIVPSDYLDDETYFYCQDACN